LALAEISGSVRVIDGDTLVIEGERIRLFGIDAPELGQTCEWPNKTIQCGQIAKTAMMDLVAGAKVICLEKDTDRYGRTVAVCFVDGFDIGRNMVHTGWAVTYRKYSTDYVNAESTAKKAKRGMWKGEFVLPWEWRRKKS
jgi:endonuclease YncB( thermonuclease family)